VGAPLGLMGVGLGLCGTNQLCGGMISTSESEGMGFSSFSNAKPPPE